MASFNQALGTLVDGLDPDRHAEEIKLLSACRNIGDLDQLADDNRGFLTPSGNHARLRLVKHHSGTFLVLSYEDGWGTTLVQADFWR